MRDSDWSRQFLLRSDWSVLLGATITTYLLLQTHILQKNSRWVPLYQQVVE